MTSPTHDATALAVAFVLFPPAGDASGLGVTALMIAVMGVAEALAGQRQRREMAAWREKVNRQVAEGMSREVAKEEVERPRWHGLRRSVTYPLRAVALLGAASAAMPLAVALGCARLPDQLEFDGFELRLWRWRRRVLAVDHRKLTHYLLTAAVLIVGVRYGALWLAQASPDVSVAQGELLWQAFAVGYLTHLAMDGCTRSGVPLLWPLCREDVHLVPEKLRVAGREFKVAPRTGGAVDVLVMFGALASVVLAAQG